MCSIQAELSILSLLIRALRFAFESFCFPFSCSCRHCIALSFITCLSHYAYVR